MPWPLQIVFWLQLAGIGYDLVEILVDSHGRPDPAKALAYVVVSVLEVLLLVKLRAGRRWARSVLAVLTALTVMFSVARLITGSVPPILTTVSALLILVLLYLPKSNAFFDARQVATAS